MSERVKDILLAVGLFIGLFAFVAFAQECRADTATFVDRFSDYDFTYLQGDDPGYGIVFSYPLFTAYADIRSQGCPFDEMKGWTLDKEVQDDDFSYRRYSRKIDSHVGMNYFPGHAVDDFVMKRVRRDECNTDFIYSAEKLPDPPKEKPKALVNAVETASLTPSAELPTPDGGCARSNGPSLGLMIATFLFLWRKRD